MASPVVNKVIIVTGASKGIGAAAVKYFAAQGAKGVVLAARSEDKIAQLAKEIGEDKALAVKTDVSNPEDVKALFEKSIAKFGAVDVLVSNAGVIDPVANIADSDPAEWFKVIDINVKGVYLGLKYAGVFMPEGSTVINISSGAATSPLEAWSHYCSSKAAALMLTKCGHKDLPDLRVVGLSPGTVLTDMQVIIRASGINPVSQLDPAVHIPPEFVAKALEYLIGPAGDKYRGADFSIKTDEGRAAVGLPPVNKKGWAGDGPIGEEAPPKK